MNFLAVIPSEAKRSRGCKSADGVRTLALVFCLAFGIVSSAIAQADAEFAKANQQFAQGDFKDAIAGYEGLVRTGQASANTFYDLGNAYFRAGDFGRAILNYQRALALEQHHPEATANLQLARDEARAVTGRTQRCRMICAAGFRRRTPSECDSSKERPVSSPPNSKE